MKTSAPISPRHAARHVPDPESGALANDRALAGIRVLDFSIMLAGPYCGRLLADLGAEVIKIEPPEGDDMRQRQPLRADPAGQRHSTYFGQLNAGKRSLALDLKEPRAIEVVKSLASRSDVVLENFRPGVMQRLGLGADVLRTLNPKLVYCSISGYGQSGPGAERAAYAMLVQAESGYDRSLAQYAGQAGAEARPLPSATFVADIMGGTCAFGAIQTALVQRARTGVGQVVDVALMDCMLNLLIYEMQEAQFAPPRRVVYGPVRAADGDVLVTPVTDRNFQALAEVTGLPEFTTDPRFASVAQRAAHWAAMSALVETWTRPQPKAQVLTRLQAAGVPAADYREPRDALQDEQLRHRGLFAAVQDAAGSFIGVNAPWRMSAAGSALGARVPRVGEHSAEILRELGERQER